MRIYKPWLVDLKALATNPFIPFFALQKKKK